MTAEAEARPKTRSRLGPLLRLGVSVVLLALLFRTVRPGEVVGTIAAARPAPLLAAVFLYCVVGTWVRGQRWRALIESFGHPIALGRAVGLFLVGSFFSQLLPTGIGGDVVRALAVAREGLGRARAFSTVLVDRALGILPLLAVGLLALALARHRAPPDAGKVLLVAGLAGLAALVVLFQAHRWRGRFVQAPLLGRLVALPGLARFIDSFAEYGGRTLAMATGWSLAFTGLLVAANGLVGQAVGVTQASWLDWCIVVPLASLSTLLPSIGGWGVREWSFVWLLAQLDPPAAAGTATAVSILVGGLNLVLAAAGALVTAATPTPAQHERPT